MKISDIIEEFIKDLFDEEKEYIEIQRNELAEKFNCVPSQINYVISTRFNPAQGYYVESRRGRWRKYKNKKNKYCKRKLFNAHNNKYGRNNNIKRSRHLYK